MRVTVLIVEDETAIADTIQYALETEGFTPVLAATGQEALDRFSSTAVDLIILDIGLPDTNGFELCKQIRQKSGVPIIFLTARSEEVDRVVGLEIGGDDYVVKPFSPRELTARVKAILRRSHQNNHNRSSDDSIWQIDAAKRQIAYFGELLDLSRTEYDLLHLLLQL